MNSKRLPEKDPGETIVLCFDFTAELDPEDPLAVITGVPEMAIVVDTSLRRGEDPDVDDMLIGSPVVEGNQVLHALTAGVDQVDYRIGCTVDIDSVPGARLSMSSIVPVRVQ